MRTAFRRRAAPGRSPSTASTTTARCSRAAGHSRHRSRTPGSTRSCVRSSSTAAMTGRSILAGTLFLVATLAACGGSLDPGSGADGGGMGGMGTSGAGGAGASPYASFATMRQIVQIKCGGASCHNSGMQTPKMMDDANLYATLKTYVSVGCGNHVLVNPGHPEQSAFYLVQSGPCGTIPQMPNGC